MKAIEEVIREKELQLRQTQLEIDALRVTLQLLADPNGEGPRQSPVAAAAEVPPSSVRKPRQDVVPQPACRLPRALSLELTLPGIRERVEADAEVVWRDPSGRVGLRFINIFPASANYLESFIKPDSGSSLPVPAYPRAIENQAPEKSLPDRSEWRDWAPSPDHLERLRQVTAVKDEIANRNLDESSALTLLAEQASDLSKASGIAIALRDKEGITCRTSLGVAPSVGGVLRPDTGLAGECVRSGKVVRCADMTKDFRVNRQFSDQLILRSTILLPLGRGKEAGLGVLAVFSTRPHAFSGSDQEVFEYLAEVITSVALRSQPGSQPKHQPSFPQPPKVIEPRQEESDSEMAVAQSWPLTSAFSRRTLWLRLATVMLVGLAIPGLWILWNGVPDTKLSSIPENYSDVNSSSASDKTVPDLMSSATTGDRDAQYALAMEYGLGKNVAQDDAESFKWLLKAANQDHVGAQRMLGSYYLAGRGVRADTNKAYQWFAIAASSGDEVSKQRVELLANLMTRPQLVKAQREVSKWLRQRTVDATKKAGQETNNPAPKAESAQPASPKQQLDSPIYQNQAANGGPARPMPVTNEAASGSDNGDLPIPPPDLGVEKHYDTTAVLINKLVPTAAPVMLGSAQKSLSPSTSNVGVSAPAILIYRVPPPPILR
jgi:GAF domain/Sel1 repeat